MAKFIWREEDSAETAGEGTEFHVMLGGLKLPDDVAKRIETEIRKIILTELALLDSTGGMTITPPGPLSRSPARVDYKGTMGFFKDVKKNMKLPVL